MFDTYPPGVSHPPQNAPALPTYKPWGRYHDHMRLLSSKVHIHCGPPWLGEVSRGSPFPPFTRTSSLADISHQATRSSYLSALWSSWALFHSSSRLLVQTAVSTGDEQGTKCVNRSDCCSQLPPACLIESPFPSAYPDRETDDSWDLSPVRNSLNPQIFRRASSLD